VSGNFNCVLNKLTSLEGSPTTVGGYFYCNNNSLTSLNGCPVTILGSFDCSFNNITTTYLMDIDIEIGENVNIVSNPLPQLFNDNIEHILLILKYQRHFMIWNDDLTLNEENFNNLIADIKDGLE